MHRFPEGASRVVAGFLIIGLAFFLMAGCLQPLSTEDLLLSPQLDPTGKPLAYRVLPKARMGYVDWVAAVKDGTLMPRESLDPKVPTSPALALDIIFKTSNAYPMPDVVFPHVSHTLWLDCSNCHPRLFTMRQGANPISMDRIIKGQFCGRCHGIVAFPFEDCFRCHSRPK